MRKVRSLVILTLVMSLLLSMLCVAPATAASTLEFQGTTTTVFDQSFGGLSAAPSAFSMDGTWTYTPKYSVALGTNDASIMSEKAYDASAGKGYIFKIGASYSINGFIMYLGWDSSTNTGYQLAMYQNIMYLYKDAAFSTNTTTGLGNHANCVAVSKTYPGSNAYYDLRRYYTVTVTDAGVTVSSDRDANMITYTLPKGKTVSKNGKFGVKSQYTSNFAVWYMTLETIDSNIKVNRWMVDETFNTSDTLDSLKSQGFSFGSSATLVSDGLKTGGNTSMTYDYAALSGDYVVETSVFKSYNSNYLIFNYVDDNNHYVYRYGQKGDHSLTKVVNGTSYVLDEVPAGSSYQGTYVFTTYVLRNEVDETTGDLKITVTRKNSATKVVEVTDYYDDKNETTPNGAPITEGKFKHKFDSTGDTRIGYFKAYSLVDAADQQETVMYEETVFDKTFTSADTISDLRSNGLTFSGTPTISDNGVSFASNNAYYNGGLEGTYSFDTSIFRKFNETEIRFGIQDSSNYYRLFIGFRSDTDKNFKLSKFVGGREYVLATKVVGSDGANYGYWNTTAYSVSVAKDAAGNVKINATITPSRNTTNTLSAVDYVADANETEPNGAPYTGGTMSMYAGEHSVLKSFTAKKMVSDADTNGEIPVFKGRFYNGSNAIKAMAKGEIYFGYPTKLLGDYTVLACLYDNNEMIDIAVLDELDIYKDKTMLFDTTSVSDDAYIKVYFIDSLGRMNYLSDVYTLN